MHISDCAGILSLDCLDICYEPVTNSSFQRFGSLLFQSHSSHVINDLTLLHQHYLFPSLFSFSSLPFFCMLSHSFVPRYRQVQYSSHSHTNVIIFRSSDMDLPTIRFCNDSFHRKSFSRLWSRISKRQDQVGMGTSRSETTHFNDMCQW